ncbi:hypothetical protein H9K76_00140 [Diaphorobacter ruginosibacter]|uniref:Uncharacterized protein n=1 Tax=Diaphorobacter ruginosibacter TaxID=1715720 RepID=A0A7G9RP32_9BURK|nr:hypothetical protein [Diaphorobacter ruginosibacter]QNN56245.1 hypothetical protein H9K76_17030 [Diaphorobacter ruginosibacter]QNN57357.1 hypothetical protein H9K76_00140 [Diaphorobacter ruginosibacter]
MQKTMELWAKAQEIKSPAQWAREFNVTPEAFYVAKRQGRLSPILAGNVAIELGENPEHWMAIAALEAEKESPLVARLQRAVNSWRRL